MTIASRPANSIRRALISVLSLTCMAFANLAFSQQKDERIEVMQHDFKTSTSTYTVQKQLLALTAATQDFLNTLGQLRPVDPWLLETVNRQYAAIQVMTPDEFDVLAKADLDLVSLVKQINDLTDLLNDYANQATPSTSYITNPAAVVPSSCPIYTGSNSEMFPPGPCAIDGLSDTPYPYSVCPVSVGTGVMWATRALKVVSFVVSQVAEKFCYQALFGNNGSVACIVTDVLLVSVLASLDYFDKCNGRRTAAETMGTYERLGDMFVRNKTNFAAQYAGSIQTYNQVGDTEVALENDLSEARLKIDTSLENGFDGTQSLLTDIETQAIQNAQELDQALADQLDIMEQLGISYLHTTPGDSSASATSFETVTAPATAVKTFHSGKTGLGSGSAGGADQ